MRKEIANEVRSAGVKRVGALEALRRGSEGKRIWNGKRRFDCESLSGVTLTDLLDAVAAASAGILFGFNRSGGLNVVVLLEGDKETYTVYDVEEFGAVAAVIIQAMWNYASDKYPDLIEENSARINPATPTGG